MCGIFGIILKPQTNIPSKNIEVLLEKLAKLSESRGKDSSGIAFRNDSEKTIHVIKGDIPIRRLLRSNEFSSEFDKNTFSYQKGEGFAAFGHARLVTNGSQLQEVNNQPVVKNGMIVIHNGIIVNVDELWNKHDELQREYLIDTEIIPSLIRSDLNQNSDLVLACNKTFNQLEGTYSMAVMFEDLDLFILATNNGSLYYLTDNETYLIFASESYFLSMLQKEKHFKIFDKGNDIVQLKVNQGFIINLKSLKQNYFNIPFDKTKILDLDCKFKFEIQIHQLDNLVSKEEVVIDPLIYINRSKESHLFNLLEDNSKAIASLKRCTKCILPQTFPFIEFDEYGVCNYCNHYIPKNKIKPIDELKALVEPYRKNNGKPDCLVPFSGGRDSTFALHIVKNELGLNPIAFTYDWGMVTDLARRNIARVCSKLGVENIIVSANIRWKRENIKKNIIAWLANPSLGMIPIFMAGDKYFYYYADKVRKRNDIKLNLFGMNNLENTDFKTGFAGVAPNLEKKYIYSLSISQQVRLLSYVGKQYFLSPKYFNQSLFDTFGSYLARYFTSKQDYYHIFDYLYWDEDEVESILYNYYKWEKAIDTKTTWRIGDGTASFYNYIYYTVAGFSEYDSFRGNQVREGMIDREFALKLVNEENHPRYETIRWYLEILGLDFETVIKRINSIPKIYTKY